MHFSQINEKSGPRFGKLAVVAALHVALGALFVHTLNRGGMALPKVPEALVVMFTPDAPPPPPPPQPPKPVPKTAPPQVIAPPVEVPVQPPPPDTVAAVVSPATTVQPSTPAATAVAGPSAPLAPPQANSGVMRSVALADASGCTTPAYPPRAARNNESGTVMLALLVGSDGRVSEARVQSSSGSRELDKAAIAALSSCTFRPAMNGGVAEPGWAQIAYVWTLE